MNAMPQRQPPGRLARWWAATSDGLPKPFWYLLAGAFVNRIGYMVEPFLALYLVGPRNLDPSTVGVVLAAFGAGAFASQPIGGYLADRFGRRASLVGGMIATAASFMLLASVRDPRPHRHGCVPVGFGDRSLPSGSVGHDRRPGRTGAPGASVCLAVLGDQPRRRRRRYHRRHPGHPVVLVAVRGRRRDLPGFCGIDRP
jgi:MFS family permease